MGEAVWQGQSADFGAFRVVNDQATNKVAITSQTSLIVDSWTTDAPAGTFVCNMGATTNCNKCGYINTDDASASGYSGLYQVDYPMLKGDSGGPMYILEGNGNAEGIATNEGFAGSVGYACSLREIYNFASYWSTASGTPVNLGFVI
jgi:hypothetical protein